MVTPLKSANTIDFNRARQQSADRPGNDDAGDPERDQQRLQLLSALQTTLSLESIISLFHGSLEELVQLTGLRYVHEARKLQLLEGDMASHSCGYRLHTRQGDLGEIIIYRGRRFSDEELGAVESLLMTLVHPLRNALQYLDVLNASITDPLTGVGNRAGLDEALEREIALARRYEQPLSLLMIDIDRFKSINDAHGHGAGDVVLRDTVERFSEVHRSTDMCFRYGGEEFVILLNRTDQHGAVTIADRIRSRVADTPFRYSRQQLQVTVSVGISEYGPADSRDTLFTRADKALYEIKQQGGNQVRHL